MDSINQADGAGQIDIGGRTSPVSYHVIASHAEAGAATEVRIEVSLPRDWLMERGFKSDAVLIRENGSRTTVRADDALDVDAPISVVLTSDAEAVPSQSELGASFPELKVR